MEPPAALPPLRPSAALSGQGAHQQQRTGDASAAATRPHRELLNVAGDAVGLVHKVAQHRLPPARQQRPRVQQDRVAALQLLVYLPCGCRRSGAGGRSRQGSWDERVWGRAPRDWRGVHLGRSLEWLSSLMEDLSPQ